MTPTTSTLALADLEQRLRQQAVMPFGPEGFALLTEAADALARRAAQPVAPVQADAQGVDDIVTALYRRFKDWSKRGFGPDDVTWCEVKADVISLIGLATPSPQIAEVAELPKPYGYAVEQKDGHVTFFKEDPKGFRGKVSGESLTWAELGINVHDLFTRDAIAASRRASAPASAGQAKKVCGAFECKAGQRDGVTCAEGECDIDSGVRTLSGSAEQAAPADIYNAALLAVERMRGFAATIIEDHAKDTYPGHVGCRPQDVATMWAKKIHDIDAKAFLDEAIADQAAQPAEGAGQAGQVAKLVPHVMGYPAPASDTEAAYTNGWNDCRATMLGEIPDDPANLPVAEGAAAPASAGANAGGQAAHQPDMNMVAMRLRQILDPQPGTLSAQWHAADAMLWLTGDAAYEARAWELQAAHRAAATSAGEQ